MVEKAGKKGIEKEIAGKRKRERLFIGLSFVSFFVPFTVLYFYVETSSVNDILELGENIGFIYFVVFGLTVLFLALGAMTWRDRVGLESH